MRLVFSSDLHVEHHPEVAEVVSARARRLGADVLVIAGDLGGRPPLADAALAALAQGAPTVAFVPGNHNLWTGKDGPDSRTRYLETLPEACERAGVRYLPTGAVRACGVTLLGQTGWYDYSLRDPGLAAAVPLSAYREGRFGRLAWSDPHFVRWPGCCDASGRVDDAALTAWMSARLTADLAAAPRDRPAVVVTHMLPFDGLAARRPLPWGFVRGFLGARSLGDAIVAAAAGGLDVALAICGHTHFARRTAVRAGGRVVHAACSPIGYPREYKRMGFANVAALVEHRVRAVEIDVPAHARRAA
jgi:Icc-related predicted phosphoesterase